MQAILSRQSYAARPQREHDAATARALTGGGDARIELSFAGTNQYGCPPRPDALLVPFGSSTASVVSTRGFQSAAELYARLRRHPQRYCHEALRLRQDLLALTGASSVLGTEVVLAASGTDIHLIATQIAAQGGSVPLQAVMVEPAETGSGVPAALSAIHFSARTCQGNTVFKGDPIAGPSLREPAFVQLRYGDGTPRHADDVDAEFASRAERIVRSGGHCLVVLTDLSKTGLIAPSPACAARLRSKFGSKLIVLVDACQFRLSPSTLRAYLEQEFMVAITGSKFVTGPAFCGALLLPPGIADCARARPLSALRRYSSRSDWPEGWPSAAALDDSPNVGLLLRWKAALTELSGFRAVPTRDIQQFLMNWGHAVADRIASDPTLEALPVAQIARTKYANQIGWDSLQTIFPFLVYRHACNGKRVPLCRDQTAKLHRQLQEIDLTAGALSSAIEIETTRFQLGQPVPCGLRAGTPVSALRMCSSARWATEAAGDVQGTIHAVRQAMKAFDKLTLLARRLDQASAHLG